MYTVTLIDETGQRIFNVGVERQEALPIVAALHNLPLPRPQTINVMAGTLKFHGITLEEVRLERVSISPIYLFSTVLRWCKGDKSEIVQASILGKAPPFPEEGLEQRKKDFLAFLLGSAYPPLSS